MLSAERLRAECPERKSAWMSKINPLWHQDALYLYPYADSWRQRLTSVVWSHRVVGTGSNHQLSPHHSSHRTQCTCNVSPVCSDSLGVRE